MLARHFPEGNKDMTPKFRLLTEKELSGWIGLSVVTLRTWRSRPPENGDAIPYTKVGGKIRYREDLVIKWLERNTSMG